MTAEQIVEALGGYNGMVPCPAHDDRNPSCSVNESDNGEVLVHCHAGCTQSEVIDALKGRGLWSNPQRKTSLKASKNHAAKANRDAEKRAQQEIVAKVAQSVWDAAKAAQTDHPYLTSKKLPPGGLRVDSRGELLVPMYDETEKLWNVQRIFQDGFKLFLKGGRTKGLYSSIGSNELVNQAKALCLCEGWATGAAIHEATDLPVICALSAGNLKQVATIIRKKYPTARLIICADNDENGVGQQAAIETAHG